MNKRELVITVIFLVFCAVLYFLPTGFEKAVNPGSVHARAIVLEVSDDMQAVGVVKVGSQFLQVRLLDGPQASQEISVINQLFGKLEVDEYYKVGDSLLVEYQSGSQKITGYARGHYRLNLEICLALLFAGTLCLVAGWTGFRAMLSFVFAVMVIWKVMIPLFLNNIDPFAVSVVIVLMLTASISFLVGGLNRKGIVAFMGACSGLLIACLLAFIFAHAFQINGAVRPFAENLLYSGYADLDITRIFICGIFIACSGAVMDLAMDISASMDEIMRKKPDIHYLEHVLSGLRIGRPVIGTMTTTLLLAYSGGYTCMMMFFMGQGTPLCQVLNMNYVAAELMNVLIGSFGIVAVAPSTAIIAGFVYHHIN